MFHKLKEVKYFKEIKCFKIVQKEEVYRTQGVSTMEVVCEYT